MDLEHHKEALEHWSDDDDEEDDEDDDEDSDVDYDYYFGHNFYTFLFLISCYHFTRWWKGPYLC